MKVFVIVITQENTIRFAFMRKEHGMLHDKKRKQSYAIVRDAYQTNWKGRFGVAYVVRELDAQTVRTDATEPVTPNGTVSFEPVVRMRTKVEIPGSHGEEATIHLTAEGIWDKIMSLQVRRMANRRYNFVQALLIMSLGFAFGVMVVLAGIFVHGASTQTTPSNGPPIVVTPGGAPGSPQSGPAPTTPSPVIVVQHGNNGGTPTGGG